MKNETGLKDIVVDGRYYATIEGDIEKAITTYPKLASMNFWLVDYPYYEPEM